MKDLHQLFVLNAVGLLSRIYSKTADKPLPVRGSPGPVLQGTDNYEFPGFC